MKTKKQQLAALRAAIAACGPIVRTYVQHPDGCIGVCEPPPGSQQINRSDKAAAALRPALLGHVERFAVLALNRVLKPIAPPIVVSEGGMHATVADPKLIFAAALSVGAACIVVAHNHPSGILRPSEEDIRLTQKIVQGGGYLDIDVQDHIIITADSHYSFADNGMLH